MATAKSIDTATLISKLRLINSKGRGYDLLEAVVEDPQIRQTIDGASTLEVQVSDSARKLLRADYLGERSFAVVDGLHLELVAIAKTRDKLTLTWEDGIVAALRRRDGRLSEKGGTLTRRQFAIKLAAEAHIKYAVDDTKRKVVAAPLQRSVDGDKTNSWDVLGDVAREVNWRRFSDGTRLVVGGDDWLLERDRFPTTLREFTGGVQHIDFTLDTGRKASTAAVDVDVEAWGLPPGSVCRVVDVGPADGKWLVSGYTRGVVSPRGKVDLVRGTHALPEPKRARNAGGGDDGETDNLPGQDGTDDGGAASSPARETMVNWALAQQGKRYVYGTSGPDTFDCSGLVQEATRAAGKVLAKPSASQTDTVIAAGGQLSLEAAINTRGALLWHPGHIAISLGNGSTMEAMGTPYGCLIGNAVGRFSGGGIWI